MAQRFWNNSRVTALEVLWLEGWRASELGKKLGTTRHAVLGKLNRLGLLGRLSEKEYRRRCSEGARERYAKRRA